jgi:pimeloyl-ACP methyl ester carboxylesterase
MDGSAGAYWQLRFEADGSVVAGAESVQSLVEQIRASGTQDLFVMSHGWGNSEEMADQLYQGMFGLIRNAAAVPPNARFLGVYWPSLWFPDPPEEGQRELARDIATPRPPGQADAAVSGKAIARSLADGFTGADREDVKRMGKLVDAGLKGVEKGESQAVQQERLDEFHALLGKVFATTPAGDATTEEDSGEAVLFTTDDPRDAYGKLSTVMGSAPESDTQGIGDFFGKVWNGAKDALRVGSYFQMKGRAGDIGRSGLASFLVALQTAAPGVRVHLIGHSFGARLVAFALAGIGSPEQSPVASLTLVQGAFSHWSFSDGSSDLGIQGALSGFQNRVKGPLCATFTSADWAVGNWYPKASFLAQQDNQDSEGANRWGAMGADGYRGVTARDLSLPLTGQETFVAGEFHRADANFVITDTSQSSFAGAHSDIQKPEVAALIVAAARAGGG